MKESTRRHEGNHEKVVESLHCRSRKRVGSLWWVSGKDGSLWPRDAEMETTQRVQLESSQV